MPRTARQQSVILADLWSRLNSLVGLVMSFVKTFEHIKGGEALILPLLLAWKTMLYLIRFMYIYAHTQTQKNIQYMCTF